MDNEFFEPYAVFSAQHSESNTGILEAIQDGNDNIKSFTTDEFLLEAYKSATMLLHVFGDTDGLIADQAQNIRQNIIVIATSIHKDPVNFFFDALRSMENSEEQIEIINKSIDRLSAFRESL